MKHIFSNNFRKSYYLIFLTFFITIVALVSFYLINIYLINKEYYKRYEKNSLVSLRKFPYPYKAAMAISSDIDNTETLEEFMEIQKFLHTNTMTSMGKGIELEIGNSFFFYEPSSEAISYFLSGPEVAETIIQHIKAGFIDVLHSYGKKLDFTRLDAIAALKELKNKNCKIDVWVDHTKSRDNLGDDVTFGLGDHIGVKEYHSDLTLKYGIKFAWLGRVTMVSGQSVPITWGNFSGIFDQKHPIKSIANITKELSKNILGVFGYKKYAIHRDNDLVKITKLDDGQKVYEFIRFDNYWKGVGRGADSKNLSYSISKKTINKLKKVGGYMIVYTHLGRNYNESQFIPEETQNALRNLSNEYKAGNIYVTTTSKLLNYYLNHKYLSWSYEAVSNEIIIRIQKVNDPLNGKFLPTLNDIQGITFYVPDKNKARIFINEKEIKHIQRNFSDKIGRESITIPMTFLRYHFQHYNDLK